MRFCRPTGVPRALRRARIPLLGVGTLWRARLRRDSRSTRPAPRHVGRGGATFRYGSRLGAPRGTPGRGRALSAGTGAACRRSRERRHPEVQRRARRGLVQRTRCRALRGQGERSARCAADRIVLLTPGRNARGHHGTHRVEAGLRGHPAARPSRAAPRSTALRSSPTCFVAQRAARAKKTFRVTRGLRRRGQFATANPSTQSHRDPA